MLPKALHAGDTVGVVAPSKSFTKEKQFELDGFVQYLHSRGVSVITSENFYAEQVDILGAVSAEKRAADINSMFANSDIHAIWCFQGGEPANQILDLIDWDLVRNNPKIFIGKSDIDVLLLALNKMTGLIPFHACDAKIGSNKELDFEYTKKWFEKRLFKKSKAISPSIQWTCVNEGKAEGRILGCNLSSILKLAGTKYFPDFTDVIFFIETFRSSPNIVRTQLTQLKQMGVLGKIRGVVIGSNYEFSSEGVKPEEVIRDFLVDFDLPILKINEFGHYQPHAFLPIGALVELDATNKSLSISTDLLS